MKKKFKIGMILMMMALFAQIVPVKAFANVKDTKVVVNNEAEESGDIVDIIINDGRFKTLSAALKAANLVDSLKGNGPFTIFAPTDDAFAKLPTNTVNDLLKPENKDNLVKILDYHVTPGKILASDIMKLNGKDIRMSNEKKAKIEVRDNQVFIDGAKIISKDIMGKNGVIHVIDTVMMPE